MHARTGTHRSAAPPTFQIQRAWQSTISAGAPVSVALCMRACARRAATLIVVRFWLHLLRIQKVERELRSREAGDARSLWTEGPVEVIPTPSYVPMAEPLCGPLRYSVRGRPFPTFAGMTSPHSAPFGRGPAELMRGWPSKRWKRNWIKADLRRRVSGDGRSCAGLRSALLTSPTAWTADRLLRPRPARTVS